MIRVATVSDIEGVFGCAIELADYLDKKHKEQRRSNERVRTDFYEERRKELLREITDRNALFLVAEQGDSIVGFAHASFNDRIRPYYKTHRRGKLHSLFVKEEFRSTGVAHQLVQETEQWWKKQGCTSGGLSVIASNEMAIKFYQKMGYKVFSLNMGKHL